MKAETGQNPEKAQLPETLKGFLEMFKGTLKEKIKRKFNPLHDPNDLSPLDRDLLKKMQERFDRKPKKGQDQGILAAVKGFKKHRTLFVIGEMGVGKTFIGIATAILLCPERSRTIVLCPTHLIEKWVREIKKVAPNAIVKDLSARGISDLMEIKKEKKPMGREFYVLGKETAKMHYERRIGFNFTQKIAKCPACGVQLLSIPDIRKHRPICHECGEPLWQASKFGIRRFAKAEFIKKYLPKGVFDLFIADEIQQYKAGDSSQGQAYANIIKRSNRVLNLTGTLMGGYSTNLFYLLWRSCHKAIEKRCAYRKPMDFAKRYGVIDRIEKEADDAGATSIGRRKTYVRVAEKPGISPTVLTDLLLERCIFISLSDVADDLPAYDEEVIEVPMSENQGAAYKAFQTDLVQEVKMALARGDKSLLGPMVQSLLAYPDGCRRGEAVYHPRKTEPNGDRVFIASAPAIDEEMLPKEEALLELVNEQKAKGRKCLVCYEHTVTRDLTPDLKERLEKEGHRVLAIKSTSATAKKREAWLTQKMEAGYDEALTNPRLIETGLDLVMFPTIIFFQTGYSTFTLRQSSRRSWRIGQERDVKVFYLTYLETAQDTALSLMADKIQVALMVEGNISDSGLTSIANGEASILVQVAKTILGEGKTASARRTFKGIAAIERTIESRLDEGNKEKPATVRIRIRSGEKTKALEATRKMLGIVTPGASGDHASMPLNGAVVVFESDTIYVSGDPVGKYGKNGLGFIITHNPQGTQSIRYIQLLRLEETDQYGFYVLSPRPASCQAA